jgi:UDPglucose--hexose-1-phosphate uridylyltransferase
MLELRKDYILERWVIAASVRGKRPKQFKEKHKQIEPKICYFCPGNEKLTPPEIGRVEKKGKWILRWFPNKFPFVEQKGITKIKTKGKFFKSTKAYGKHEVIADTNDHKKQLWDMSKSHIKLLLEVIKKRTTELEKLKNINYVSIFKNHGKKAGTSIIHSHIQVAALSQIPPQIKEETEAIKKHKKCPYCDILKIERKSKRKCFENKTAISIAPYASRFNYETWIFPKRHIRKLSDLKDNEIADMAEILQKTIAKLKTLDMSYNFFIHYSPKKDNLHLHIEIAPRIATWAGFEFSSGITINSVLPEDAARFYRF